jgi:hypothetical protein
MTLGLGLTYKRVYPLTCTAAIMRRCAGRRASGSKISDSGEPVAEGQMSFHTQTESHAAAESELSVLTFAWLTRGDNVPAGVRGVKFPGNGMVHPSGCSWCDSRVFTSVPIMSPALRQHGD